MKTLISIAFLMIFVSNVFAQWQKQTVATDAGFRGLSVVNENVIWASGTGGTVIRTTDGGKNWQVIKVPEAEKLDFRDIEAFDENTAYILSIGTGESSRIYKTTDGGKNWKLQFKNTDEKAFFDALAFWDKDHGMAMSDPVNSRFLLIGTEDGQNWSKPLGLTAGTPEKFKTAGEGEAAFAASGTCLLTQGKKNIFLVSGGSISRVFRSWDRGDNWDIAETPIVSGTAGSGIFSIAMYDKKRGVIVGGNYEKPDEITNNLAFTTDGGKSWKLGKGLNGYRSAVDYIDKKTIIAVGANGSDISFDSGKTWKNLDRENYNAVRAKGKRAVWAVGPKGMVAKYSMAGR